MHGKWKSLPMDTQAHSILDAEHIILATGSTPIKLPCAPIDNEFIIDSIAALNLDAVPKKLAIIGAGVVGLELASIWNRLGAETILLEAQENFLSLLDQQISGEAYRILQPTRAGFTFGCARHFCKKRQ